MITMKKTLATIALALGTAFGSGCHDEKKHAPAQQACSPVYQQFNFTSKENIAYSLPLARCPDEVNIDAGNFPAGNYRLHFYEAPDDQTKTIAPLEFFVLTNRTGTPFTHVLRYVNHDGANRQLTFEDLGTGTRQIVYDGITNSGDLIVGGKTYGVKVDPVTGRLGIDQTADGLFNGMQAPIVANDDTLTLEEDLLAP
jgi:hypothetical protein